MRDRKKNILVISDLHLGEGLRQCIATGGAGAGSANLHTWSDNQGHLERLEVELSSFLIHYTRERIHGRPWRLVINGDMVDFMSILLFPKPVGSGPHPADVVSSMRSGDVWGEEEVFGLGTGEKESALKLRRVLDHHEQVFRLLGRFVSAGNDLVIVFGNHDIEFCHQAVQRTFVERLVELSGDAQVVDRVQFCPWFYYEQDLIYIEHGHQYDEYCSFDYQLCPASLSGGLALSFAHTGMRFFGNLVPSYDQRTAERWGLLDYLRWGYSLGIRTMLWLTYMYGLLAWKGSQIGSLLSHPREDAERRRLHRARLQALSQTLRIQEEKLLLLDGLRVPPAIRKVERLLCALFLDRVLLCAASVLILPMLLLLCPGLWKLLAALLVTMLALGLNQLLGRLRGAASPSALRRVIGAIHRIVRAPFIVFGHSHEAERVVIAEGAVYYNTGTWMTGGGNHVGTHLVVLSEPGDAELVKCPGPMPYAEMRKWQDGAAVKIEL